MYHRRTDNRHHRQTATTMQPGCFDLSFVHPPAASFAARRGRTTPPPKYELLQQSPSVYTLVSKTTDSGPAHIHILPTVHAARSSTPALLRSLQTLHPAPKALVLELCAGRAHLLQRESAPHTTEDKTRRQKNRPFSFQTILEAILQQQTNALQTAINRTDASNGPDQLREVVETWQNQLQNPKRSIVLGDRKIEKTLQQWANKASLSEKLTILLDVTMAPFFAISHPSWPAMLQDAQQVDLWRSQLARRAPAAFHSLCVMRELHMTWAVRDCASVMSKDSVALVCGALHARTVVELLEKGQVVDIDSVSNAQ